jgi:hypothetical protein
MKFFAFLKHLNANQRSVNTESKTQPTSSLLKKNPRNFVDFFALASKKWLKQKTKALDDLNY